MCTRSILWDLAGTRHTEHRTGRSQSGRTRQDCALSCAIFVVTGDHADETAQNKLAIKSQIAFYASTPSYSSVLELANWELHVQLNELSRQGRWFEMGELISDDLLNEFAVVAPMNSPDTVGGGRYTGRLGMGRLLYAVHPSDADKAVRCGKKQRKPLPRSGTGRDLSRP